MNPNIREEALDLGFGNPDIRGQASVLIGQVSLSTEEMKRLGGQRPRELSVFAARIPSPLPEYPDAWRMEFLVVEAMEGKEGAAHHLFQCGHSVFYEGEGDVGGSESADMLAPADIRHLRRAPKWKRSEASIPTGRHGSYHFLSQFHVPANATTRQYLCAGDAIFLFVESRQDDQLSIKIHCQDMAQQTAEEHYRLEEMMAEFDRFHARLDNVEPLIRKGTKDFHRYVLEHPRAGQETLQTLLKHVRSKGLRSEIEKKLKLLRT